VVIGVRLFSLPIQVEGLEGNDMHAAHMDVDDGNSGGGHNMEGREDGPSANNAARVKGSMLSLVTPLSFTTRQIMISKLMILLLGKQSWKVYMLRCLKKMKLTMLTKLAIL
jgi:hypothetical protein